jgi:ribosome-associated protein
MTETAAKKDVQKLQRTVVDSLEDVKAQQLVVFDTEHISSLFERVVIASGTSNRQTKALAASVRDKVREAGFPKPRIEGEDNGEWIIVDCGAVVVHIMQPTIRQYYNLEEIWGEKPVRLKFGAPKPLAPVKAEPKVTPKKAAAKKTVAKKSAPSQKTISQPSARKTTSKTAPKATFKSSTKPVTKVVGKPAAKKSAAKPTTKKPAVKKPLTRKA